MELASIAQALVPVCWPPGAEWAHGPAVPLIMRPLEATQDVELSCDEVLALMDVCAEAALGGDDLARALPLFEKHIECAPIAARSLRRC